MSMNHPVYLISTGGVFSVCPGPSRKKVTAALISSIKCAAIPDVPKGEEGRSRMVPKTKTNHGGSVRFVMTVMKSGDKISIHARKI